MAQLKDTIINGDLNLSGTLTTNMGGGQHPLLDLIYPIGSVIMTVDKNFKPNEYWGGTWVDWKDGYLKVDDTPSATAQGDYKISSDNLPTHTHTLEHTHTLNSHTHTLSHTHSLNGHTHTLNHTHGYTPAGTISGGAHTHNVIYDIDRSGTGYSGYPNLNLDNTDSLDDATRKPTDSATPVMTFTGTPSNTTSQSTTTTSGPSKTSTGDASTTTTSGPSHTNTGDASTTTTSGSFDNSDFKPKYYAVIAWQRTK